MTERADRFWAVGYQTLVGSADVTSCSPKGDSPLLQEPAQDIETGSSSQRGVGL